VRIAELHQKRVEDLSEYKWNYTVIDRELYLVTTPSNMLSEILGFALYGR